MGNSEAILPQQVLDTRALEVAAGTERALRSLEERVERHENKCVEAYRQASEERREFRNEMVTLVNKLIEKQTRTVQLIVLSAIPALGYLLVFWVEHSGPISIAAPVR
jgi:hypothetical protein